MSWPKGFLSHPSDSAIKMSETQALVINSDPRLSLGAAIATEILDLSQVQSYATYGKAKAQPRGKGTPSFMWEEDKVELLLSCAMD